MTARFDRASLASGVARAAEDGDEHSRELIAYQPGTAAQHLHIVRADGMARCSPGEAGEIWIAGPGVARGYWDQPEETAQTFGARLADIGDVASNARFCEPAIWGSSTRDTSSSPVA